MITLGFEPRRHKTASANQARRRGQLRLSPCDRVRNATGCAPSRRPHANDAVAGSAVIRVARMVRFSSLVSPRFKSARNRRPHRRAVASIEVDHDGPSPIATRLKRFSQRCSTDVVKKARRFQRSFYEVSVRQAPIVFTLRNTPRRSGLLKAGSPRRRRHTFSIPLRNTTTRHTSRLAGVLWVSSRGPITFYPW